MKRGSGLSIERNDDGVLLIAFERNEVMNAFDMASFAALGAAMADAQADDDVRVIVLTGRGGRAFSAGFDIHEMVGFDAAQKQEAFVKRDPVMRQVAEHPCPVIAAVDGICYGGGALLAMACDIRIGTPAFRLKVTAVGYGGANGTWSLPAIVGRARAKEILMSGRIVDADEALAIGLISRLVPSDDIEAEAIALARTIAEKPPIGVQGIKRLVDGSAGLSPIDGWQAEHDWMLANTDFASDGGGLFTSFSERRKKPSSDAAPPSGE